MASLATDPPLLAKRLKLSTVEALKQEPDRTIEIGILVLPAGIESTCGILTNILQYLDIKTLCNVKRSSLIQQFRKEYGSYDFERVRDVALQMVYNRRSINEMIQTHPARRLYFLIERYKREFPQFPHGRPFICACEHGRTDDVQLFMNLHPFHKYITNRDVNGYRDDMTLKDMVNQGGRISEGYYYTALQIAAKNEHFQIVKYLIEQGEADPNIADSIERNALHYAAMYNETNIDVIRFLLTHMTINKKAYGGEFTPLDCAYSFNNSPLRQEIIALLRSKGGKANCHDANGRRVGEGNGDLGV